MKKIRELRLEKGMSQLELAKQLGVERTTITKWENDCSNPRIDMLGKIAKVLNCKITDLLYQET